VIALYPFLKDGLPDHRDEVLRIAKRIVRMETEPVQVPDLPADATEWEKVYWQRTATRS
jgi:hypothetical protein